MPSLITLLHLAAAVHLCVAAANVFAFGKFRYREHLRAVPLIVQQVFLVQNAYIMALQVGMALLCAFFAPELTSGRAMSVAIAGFLAVFWISRVVLQLGYYDRTLRRANRGFDVLFVLADAYLGTVYAATSLVAILRLH
ncbi:MAG: hypothetical protein ABI780_14280 [Ardenticatenales bacterium]